MTPRDRGAASIWLLGIGLAAVVLAGSVVVACGVLVAHHRAQAAADLAALGGAARASDGLDAACVRAAQLARMNRAVLVDCHLNGLDMVVVVAVTGAAGGRDIRATARAGPAPRAPGDLAVVGFGLAAGFGPAVEHLSSDG